MFDSKLCDRWLPQSPFLLEGLQFVDQFNKPIFIALLFLAGFGFHGLIQHKRLKYWINSQKIYLFLFGFIATLPLLILAAEKGLVIFLPPNSGTTADVIVVLGRGEKFRQQRVDVATEVWQAKRAPIIFTTGRGDAERMIEQLQEKGIPNQALDGENCALTTLQNAIFTAAILHQQGLQRILLITDEPHMGRALLMFRNQGFTVIPHTIPLPANWSFQEKAFITVREVTGLVSYSLRGLFLPQGSSELNTPEIVNIQQQAVQYGQQRASINQVH